MANGKCRTAKRNIVDYLKNLCADVLPSGYFRFMMIMFCVRFLCSPVSSFSFIFNKRITWRHPQVFSSLFFLSPAHFSFGALFAPTSTSPFIVHNNKHNLVYSLFFIHYFMYILCLARKLLRVHFNYCFATAFFMFIGYFLLVLFDLHDERHLHFWESFLQPHIRSNLCLPRNNRKPLMAISNYTF